MHGRVVDAEGNPIVYRVRGIDRTMPDKVFNCEVEVRPGGNMVAVVVDNRPITVSVPPDALSYAAAEEARLARAEDHFGKEQAAAAMEREVKAEETEAANV